MSQRGPERATLIEGKNLSWDTEKTLKMNQGKLHHGSLLTLEIVETWRKKCSFPNLLSEFIGRPLRCVEKYRSLVMETPCDT